jgi:hypothetical protein
MAQHYHSDCLAIVRRIYETYFFERTSAPWKLGETLSKLRGQLRNIGDDCDALAEKLTRGLPDVLLRLESKLQSWEASPVTARPSAVDEDAFRHPQVMLRCHAFALECLATSATQ